MYHAQVKWFGAKEERSASMPAAVSLPLVHLFKVDLNIKHNNSALKDLVSERLAKEASRSCDL